jgi:hypothetical protein
MSEKTWRVATSGKTVAIWENEGPEYDAQAESEAKANGFAAGILDALHSEWLRGFNDCKVINDKHVASHWIMTVACFAFVLFMGVTLGVDLREAQDEIISLKAVPAGVYQCGPVEE